MTIRLKRNPLAYAEVEHVRVGAHLAEKPQARHDAIVQIDQLGFRQCVDVNRHCEALHLRSSDHHEPRVTPNLSS